MIDDEGVVEILAIFVGDIFGISSGKLFEDKTDVGDGDFLNSGGGGKFECDFLGVLLLLFFLKLCAKEEEE